MILIIDNYDSFVYNLVRYFKELGENVEVCHNNHINFKKIENNCYEGIVISPGPKSPSQSGECLTVIDRFKDKIPILGICLGHQCIGAYFGAKIIRGKRPYHGKISYINHNESGIFNGISNPLKVTRYHSLIVDESTLSADVNIDARTEDGVIMAISHKKYPIYGVQFHPEAYLTESGHKLLKNFIEKCKR